MIDNGSLRLSGDTVEAIARLLLRRGDRSGGRVVLHRIDRPDWRLILHDAPPPAWLRSLANVGALTGRTCAAYIGAGVAATMVAGGLWLFGERLLESAAPLVPQRVTRPIGETLVASLGDKLCASPGGAAALDRLVARLRPSTGFVEPVRVSVLNTSAVNALAAPGGQVVIFRGLIDKARSPDEVAGVLAHELAHVQLRHPAKALLRQFGVSLLLQSLGGDVAGFADLAVVLSSTRRAERAADAGAINMLGAAAISPKGLASFFKTMRDEAEIKSRDATERVIERLGSYAATHPASDERAALVAAAAKRQRTVTPALSATEWQALRTICAKPVR